MKFWSTLKCLKVALYSQVDLIVSDEDKNENLEKSTYITLSSIKDQKSSTNLIFGLAPFSFRKPHHD